MTDEEIVQQFNNFLLEVYTDDFKASEHFHISRGLCGNFRCYLRSRGLYDVDTYEWVPSYVEFNSGDVEAWGGYYPPYTGNLYNKQDKRVEWIVDYLKKEELI